MLAMSRAAASSGKASPARSAARFADRSRCIAVSRQRLSPCTLLELSRADGTAAGYRTRRSRSRLGRLAFQREVLDQLALMADERTRVRFQRMEDRARKEWGQDYWWSPGRTAPQRTPALEAIGGQ